MEKTLGGHTFEEHVGEVKLAVEAATPEALFVEAGRALAELMGADPAAPATGQATRVQVYAPDRAALLVEWLDELIFRAERSHQVFSDLMLDTLNERELSATIRGQPVAHLKTQVKAATFHGLRIWQAPPGLRATVVLDV